MHALKQKHSEHTTLPKIGQQWVVSVYTWGVTLTWPHRPDERPQTRLWAGWTAEDQLCGQDQVHNFFLAPHMLDPCQQSLVWMHWDWNTCGACSSQSRVDAAYNMGPGLAKAGAMCGTVPSQQSRHQIWHTGDPWGSLYPCRLDLVPTLE